MERRKEGRMKKKKERTDEGRKEKVRKEKREMKKEMREVSNYNETKRVVCKREN